MGTGDGRAVLGAAGADSGRLVVGIDANGVGMVEASRRALRRGMDNAVFVVAAAERLPGELDGVADEVTVNFPWGSLLRGLVAADATILGGIVRMMKADAALSVLVSVMDRDHGVGVGSIDGNALDNLVAGYAAQGLAVTAIRPLSAAEVVAAGSSWGRRLGAGERRPAWRIEARRIASSAIRAG